MLLYINELLCIAEQVGPNLCHHAWIVGHFFLGRLKKEKGKKQSDKNFQHEKRDA
jgi:hypothetical protein